MSVGRGWYGEIWLMMNRVMRDRYTRGYSNEKVKVVGC